MSKLEIKLVIASVHGLSVTWTESVPSVLVYPTVSFVVRVETFPPRERQICGAS